MAFVEKSGAGLLLVSGGDVLLLLRNSRHNNSTWGLPGGNRDPEDATLEATALRETEEEVGPLPPLTVARQCLTQRGKRNEKHYTVFICLVEPGVRAAWTPTLNEEHRESRWFSVESVRLSAHGMSGGPPLHPVVAALVLQYPGALEAAGTAAAATATALV